MTNADAIRQMSDEDLAILFTTIIAERDKMWMEKLKAVGVRADFIESPAMSIRAHLNYLRKERG